MGAAAHVANQYNPVGIVKALSASRATISLIASNHCKSYDADLSQMVDYVRGEGVKGIMYVSLHCPVAFPLSFLVHALTIFSCRDHPNRYARRFWAVAPFGCKSSSSPLRVADWNCDCDAKSPGLVAGKKALLK